MLFALNKSDLGPSASSVPCESMARQFGTTLIETSAMNGENVKNAFGILAREILARKL